MLLEEMPQRGVDIAKRNMKFANFVHTSTTNSIREMNKKITSFIRNGRVETARLLFDEMPERNTVTWNSMITGYIQRREMTHARKLFDDMPQRDVVSWNLMISGYASCGLLEEGKYMFDTIPQRDTVTWNTMISGYARSGKMDEALGVFNEMQEKNVVSWNAIVAGFLGNGDVRSAVEYFEMMPKRDGASLCGFVSGLISNGELDKAANFLVENGDKGYGGGDLIKAYNTLIAGYGQKGRVDDARRLFDNITSLGFKKNLVTWNSMIMCYVKAGDVVSARELFEKMGERDIFSWNTVITGYVNVLDMNEAFKLFQKMPKPDILSWNSIISGFSETGDLEMACDLFRKMRYKNLVSWNSMISGYEKNKDCEGAIRLFVEMQSEGVKPDRHTLSSLLSVCAESADLQLGMQIHQYVVKLVIPDVPLNNSIITMYSRCGAIIDAKSIFDEMKHKRDVISWNAIIGGYASHGFAEEALELFSVMKRLKVQPTFITFISVLNACAHAGLVNEGRLHFKSMVDIYGIEPRVEHFASLVDLVGRFGQIEEAMSIINTMQIEPDKAVWGALLGACRVHNNVELARVAAEALMKLEPESSSPYVLLYNMYADLGRWDEAAEVRTIMDTNKIQKQPGWVIVG